MNENLQQALLDILSNVAVAPKLYLIEYAASIAKEVAK